MQHTNAMEQHIAVFGESGSGKTVLVSSFYGATQEPQFLQSSLFDVTADLTEQGHRLHRNYLGMRDAARLPDATRFSATSYAFTIKLKDKLAKAKGASPFDAVRLVWHDYPGEWFEQDVSSQEEGERRVDTFRSLLQSDVAILLVDGQRVLDNAGTEERYLKSLFASFRTGLLKLEKDLLEDGQPLVEFPRIWILALSKADLMPGFDVFDFRDLIIDKSGDDLGELRKVIERMVDSPEALAVGEDFLLLSSAKFEPNQIEVSERIGLDLILPIAAMLPLERHVKWAEQKQAGAKVAESLLKGVGTVAVALIGKRNEDGIKKLKNIKKLKDLKGLVGGQLAAGVLTVAATMGTEQLEKLNAAALAKRDHLAAVLSRFRLDMDEGERQLVFLRSRK